MRTRTGFVSNSSSSSFIVGFSSKPRSVNEVQHLLFKDAKTIQDPWDTKQSYNTRYIASLVFDDLKRGAVTDQQITDEFGLVTFRFGLDSDLFRSILKNPSNANDVAQLMEHYDVYDTIYEAWLDSRDEKDIREADLSAKMEAHNRQIRALEEKLLRNTFKNVIDMPFIYVFEYSNNDNKLTAFMEHGNIFKNIPHIVITKH